MPVGAVEGRGQCPDVELQLPNHPHLVSRLRHEGEPRIDQVEQSLNEPLVRRKTNIGSTIWVHTPRCTGLCIGTYSYCYTDPQPVVLLSASSEHLQVQQQETNHQQWSCFVYLLQYKRVKQCAHNQSCSPAAATVEPNVSHTQYGCVTQSNEQAIKKEHRSAPNTLRIGN